MSETLRHPQDKEQEATKANERLQGIDRNRPESGSELNDPYLSDPAEETGAESLGGGYGSALPPQSPQNDYIAEQLPADEHKEAAKRNLPAARKALEDARNRNNPNPPSNPKTP